MHVYRRDRSGVARLSGPNASLTRRPLRLANVRAPHLDFTLEFQFFSEPQKGTTDGTEADDMGVASVPFRLLALSWLTRSFHKERQGSTGP